MPNLGFDPDFLGRDYRIPYPTLLGDMAQQALNDGELYHYTHHTVVMNKKTRLAIYSICNVNMKNYIHLNDGRKYHYDRNIEEKYQAGPEFYDNTPYANNPFDRGHLTRRTDVCWGYNKNKAEAIKGEYDSNCWTNIAPQHMVFHANHWGKLEEWVRNKAGSVDGKSSIFTGPVHMKYDREYCIDNLGCITIPAAYYKVIFTVGSDHKLHGLVFVMRQDEFWDNNLGGNLRPLKSYQVSLSALTKITNIKFDEALYLTDPLNGPERAQRTALIETFEDIIM